MTRYRFVKRLDVGLVVLSSRYGEQIFSRRRLRKLATCVIAKRPILVGEQAYGTLNGSAQNRMERISDVEIRTLEERASAHE